MATEKDLLDLVPGRRVIISACEAREHGDNRGCLCSLMGHMFTMGKRYETVFVGTPSWWLEGERKTVRLAEITFVKES